MKRANLLTLLLSTLGLAVSLYLLSVHWGWWQAACFGVGECEVVNTSRYSELLGVPVALLGAGMYIAIWLSAWCIRNDWQAASAARVQFFVAVTGIAFSAYLTAIELFVLHAICPWCVISALLISLSGACSLVMLRALAFGDDASADAVQRAAEIPEGA